LIINFYKKKPRLTWLSRKLKYKNEITSLYGKKNLKKKNQSRIELIFKSGGMGHKIELSDRNQSKKKNRKKKNYLGKHCHVI
jgi:hypothetical protein